MKAKKAGRRKPAHAGFGGGIVAEPKLTELPAVVTGRVLWLCMAAGTVGLVLFYRRTVFSGGDLSVGDAGDARFILVILEHWWNVVRGAAVWDSPNFYHPVPRVLGWSDAFVLFAIPYVALRAVGVDAFSAQQVAIACASALGFVGMLVLLGRTLRLGWIAALTGALLFAYSEMNFMRSNHPQMYGASLLPWIFRWVVQYFERLRQPWRRRAVPIAGALAALSLTALSAMYVVWFLALFVAIAAPTGVALLVGRYGAGRCLRAMTDWIGSNLLDIAFAGLVAAVVFTPVYWLFRGNTAPFSDDYFHFVLTMLPRPPTADIGNLLLLATLAMFIVACVSLLRPSAVLFTRNEALFIIAVGVTVVICLALMVERGGRSPWWFVMDLFPGGRSVRVIYRFQQVIMAFLVLVLGLGVRAVLRREVQSRLLVALACALLAAEQYTEYGVTWSKREYRDRLARIPAVPEGCSSFFFAFAAADAWNTTLIQIDAMLVAQRDLVPTVNGYTGRAPLGWSVYGATRGQMEAGANEWVRQRGLERVCVYDTERRSWRVPGS